jgi:hypothetical protein
MGRALAFSAVLLALLAPAARAAPLPPGQDPFYRYDGQTPLAQVAPGTVLKTRTVSLHVASIPLPVRAVQLLYRSTGQIGQPTVNVTSVLRPPVQLGPAKLVSYQSLYDSLNPDDEPSFAIAGGGLSLGGAVAQLESGLITPLLLAGYTIAVPDTEGQAADFAASPEYGMNTLDGLRAAFRSPASGLSGSTRVGLIGYSGGAIATEWAAELGPTYAPDVNPRIVGAAMGGVLVYPSRNLHYVEGSSVWSGVMPMALIGIARAFKIDPTPYLSTYGLQLYNSLQKASIVQVLGAYPGLTWSQVAKPQYPTPESIPIYVKDSNKLIMSTGGTPTAPLFIGQGANGELEGTPGTKPGIGKGDGIMITGDVRTLARTYCARGVKVQYQQYDDLSHLTSAVPWLPAASAWLTARLAGLPAPQNCAAIPPGNPLTPIGG